MGMVVSAAVTGIPLVETLEQAPNNKSEPSGGPILQVQQKPNQKPGPAPKGPGTKDSKGPGKKETVPAKKETGPDSAKSKPAAGKGPATQPGAAAQPPPSAAKSKPATAKGKKK